MVLLHWTILAQQGGRVLPELMPIIDWTTTVLRADAGCTFQQFWQQCWDKLTPAQMARGDYQNIVVQYALNQAGSVKNWPIAAFSALDSDAFGVAILELFSSLSSNVGGVSGSMAIKFTMRVPQVAIAASGLPNAFTVMMQANNSRQYFPAAGQIPYTTGFLSTHSQTLQCREDVRSYLQQLGS